MQIVRAGERAGTPALLFPRDHQGRSGGQDPARAHFDAQYHLRPRRQQLSQEWLNDYFSAQSWYHPLDKTDESKVTALDRKNAQFIANYDAAINRDGLLAIQRSATPDTPENKIELRLASMRLGKWADQPTKTALRWKTPTLLDKQLAVDQLKDFSVAICGSCAT